VDKLLADGPIIDYPISISASGDNQVIAAATGFRYRIISGILTAAAKVVVTLKSGTGGGATAISGPLHFGTDGQMVLPANGGGYATTASGGALNFSLGHAVAVGGILQIQKIAG
jgi:hypothetical protein